MSLAHDLEEELTLGRTLLAAFVNGKVGKRDRKKVEKMLRGFAADPRLTPEQRQEFVAGLAGVPR